MFGQWPKCQSRAELLHNSNIIGYETTKKTSWFALYGYEEHEEIGGQRLRPLQGGNTESPERIACSCALDTYVRV